MIRGAFQTPIASAVKNIQAAASFIMKPVASLYKWHDATYRVSVAGMVSDGLATFVRTGARQATEVDGDSVTFASGAPCETDVGIDLFSSITNYIQRTDMSGASTPSTFPTGWTQSVPTGVTASIAGVGTANGRNYLDVRYQGTVGGTGIAELIMLSTTTMAAAAINEKWSLATILSVSTVTGVNSVAFSINEYNATPTLLGSRTSSVMTPTTTPTLRGFTATLAESGVTQVRPRVRVNFTVGVTIDVTIRYASPRLTKTAFIAPCVETSGAVSTTNADDLSITSGIDILTETDFTILADVALPASSEGVPRRILSLTGTGASERLIIVFEANGECRLFLFIGGTQTYTVASSALFGVSTDSRVKVAVAVNSTKISMAVNGVMVVADAVTTRPTGFDRLDIGKGISDTSNPLNGTLKELDFTAGYMPQADMTAWTTIS